MKIRVRLLGHLKELVNKEIDIEASSWREALISLRALHPSLSQIISERGDPAPGYMVFLDGVDHRIVTSEVAEEIVILPVAHGGAMREISWEEVVKNSTKIARDIEESSYRAEVVIGILRGGAVPAVLIADALGVSDVGMIEIKLYKGMKRGDRAVLRQPLTLPIADRSVLIVDDVSDSGVTLQLAIDYIRHHAPKEIRTAALYVKPWTSLYPDYYGESTEDWLIFPWERFQHDRGQ